MNTSIKPFEIISVDTMKLSCDGGGGVLGHPRVFLHIDGDHGQVQCPYCSRLYIYKQPNSPSLGSTHA